MGNNAHPIAEQPDQETRRFYIDSLEILDRAGLLYLIGGGYAMAYYTGIERHTKDLDLFVRPSDSRRALDALAAAGLRTERTWPHFLCKALADHAFVDILHNSGNGLCPVDDEWFTHAVEGNTLGRKVLLCPPEEIIWSKAFVQERDRFDGADVAHLILARGESFDWHRLLRRFQAHQRVLLAHLILFTYIYPSQRHRVPTWVLDDLYAHMQTEPTTTDPICNGPVLAPNQYTADIQKWGYIDARLQPAGPLRPEDAATLIPA
jgi:hypothetical protein